MGTTRPPDEPGYYWAKLKTPSSGEIYGTSAGTVRVECETEDWRSLDWEIVQVNDNNGEGDEKFSVDVFGIPVTQWPLDFYWGPRVTDRPPS